MELTRKRIIALVVGIAAALLYFRAHLRLADRFEVIQTELEKLSPDLLLEKSPIVVQDRIVDHVALLGTVFKYMHVKADGPHVLVPASESRTTDARFTIFYRASGPCQLDIAHPRWEQNVVRVVLHRHQTLILPYGWRFMAGNPEGCSVIHLHDVPTILSRAIGSFRRPASKRC